MTIAAPAQVDGLRAIVVDDEQLARDELCFLLQQIGGVEIVAQAGNGVEALRVIEVYQPDLVMLDVQMPGLSGFEVARRVVQAGFESHLVFVTAFDQYAIDAFEVNAVDYLLKPVEPGRLSTAVDRVRKRRAADRAGADGKAAPDLDRLVQMLSDRSGRREQLAIKVEERFLLIQADEVVHASVFWRVHRSHLVNINKIKEIVPWFSRNYILKMKDAKGTEIPVSRSQTRRLREYLKL